MLYGSRDGVRSARGSGQRPAGGVEWWLHTYTGGRGRKDKKPEQDGDRLWSTWCSSKEVAREGGAPSYHETFLLPASGLVGGPAACLPCSCIRTTSRRQSSPRAPASSPPAALRSRSCSPHYCVISYTLVRNILSWQSGTRRS